MHHFRLSALFFILVLFGASLTLAYQNHPEMGEFLLAQVGSVGINVGVVPNPYNTLAEQLAAKEQALNAKEAALNGGSLTLQFLRNEGDLKMFDYTAWGGATLFFLVLLNFYLDYRARKNVNAPVEHV